MTNAGCLALLMGDDPPQEIENLLYPGRFLTSLFRRRLGILEGRGRGLFWREFRQKTAADAEALGAVTEAPARARWRRESFRTLAHRLIFTQVLDTVDRWVKHVSKEATFAADYVNALVVIARRRKA